MDELTTRVAPGRCDGTGITTPVAHSCHPMGNGRVNAAEASRVATAVF
jgi:hypothetical protein